MPLPFPLRHPGRSGALAALAGLTLATLPLAPVAGPGASSPSGPGAALGSLARLLAPLPARAQQPSAPLELRIGAIPDQKPEKLNRLYPLVASQLSKQLGVKVKYVPVVDYAAAVGAFRTGNLDLVWFGGLTGVQARLQKPGAKVLAQRWRVSHDDAMTRVEDDARHGRLGRVDRLLGR
jgi:phosphonate transport system substrate-binding protein